MKTRVMQVVLTPAGLSFTDSTRSVRNIYYHKLRESVESGSVIQISEDDKYLRQQFVKWGKKMGLKLTYAKSAGSLYIRPTNSITTEERKLLMHLRETRDMNYLVSQRLELNLPAALKRFTSNGVIKQHINGSYSITPEGKDFIEQLQRGL